MWSKENPTIPTVIPVQASVLAVFLRLAHRCAARDRNAFIRDVRAQPQTDRIYGIMPAGPPPLAKLELPRVASPDVALELMNCLFVRVDNPVHEISHGEHPNDTFPL